MKARLKSIHLENFKGVKDETYVFGSNTRVCGMNRLGKTTIATAWFWLMADKDYELRSNPNVRPDNVEECIPTVTAVLDVDGKEVTIAKMQKQKAGKADSKGASKVALTNTYEINSVPKAERDFKEYLEALGLRFENFLVCAHPDVFTAKKTTDMRNILFRMASEKTDYDIAAMSKDTEDAAKLLSSYTFKEIEAMQKSSKQKADKQVVAIPNQIIGLEKAKVDVDVAEQELYREELERKIAELDTKIEDSGKAVDCLCSESMELQFAMNALLAGENDKLLRERRVLENAGNEAQNAFDKAHMEISSLWKRLERNRELIKVEEAKKPDVNKRWKENAAKVFDETPYRFDESKWEFDESSTVCSLCGQKLPEDKIALLKEEFGQRKERAKSEAEQKLSEAFEKFNTEKAAKKAELNAEADTIKEKIETLINENADLEKKVEKIRKAEVEAVANKNQIEKQLSELPTEPDMSSNAEYQQMKTRYSELEQQVIRLKETTNISDAFRMERSALMLELDAVKERVAQISNNIRIDEQIKELQEKQRDYEQAKADAEKILYQLSLVSKKKNELLVEEIDSHFGKVKWQLFDYQKNGEYKETCRAYICVADGTRKFLGDSMNTGREIEAKLDICNSFQKFFNMYLPIFLDGAESLNNCYMPKMDTQLITLAVSEDRELKVEVD